MHACRMSSPADQQAPPRNNDAPSSADEKKMADDRACRRTAASSLVSAATSRLGHFQSSLGNVLAFIGTLFAAATAALIVLTNRDFLCEAKTYTAYKQRSLAVCSGVVFILVAVVGPWLFCLRRVSRSNSTALKYHVDCLVGAADDEMLRIEGLCQDEFLMQLRGAVIGWGVSVWIFGVVGVTYFACDVPCWGSTVRNGKAHHHVLSLIVSITVLTVPGAALLLFWLCRWLKRRRSADGPAASDAPDDLQKLLSKSTAAQAAAAENCNV